MAIFDVIDDIAEKQLLKTETGDNRIFGVVVGTVVKNYDASMPGRLCVAVPSRDEGNQLQWARLVMPYAGSQWGIYFMPEIGDQVLVAFEQGNIERPYVIGSVPKTNDTFLKKSVSEKNEKKRIVTHNGNAIDIEDNSEDGKNDKITITTAGASLGVSHHVILDNEKHKITISDHDGANAIEMNTQNGQMEITAASKLTIKVGDMITLTMNGTSGVTELQTKDFRVNADNSMELEAVKNISLYGTTVKAEGNAKIGLSSSGPVSVEGKPIRIG